MPTNTELNDALAAYIAAYRVKRRTQIQAEMDQMRDFRVAQMNAEVDVIRDQFRAVRDIANGITTVDAVLNPPVPEGGAG